MSDILNAFIHLQMTTIDMQTGEQKKLLPMNESRYNYTWIVMGKSVYVFGGMKNPGYIYLSSCERYVEYRTFYFKSFLTDS